jgi:glycosyltransferase involved in cell wall biosynthesis
LKSEIELSVSLFTLYQMTEILYISYDGMTDSLGQSQVLPYLCGLSGMGYKITLLSCEKKEVFAKNKQIIDEIVNKHDINWEYVMYTKRPAVISTLWDVYNLKQKAKRLIKHHNFKIVHCRSYISALIGLNIKKQTGIKFIFDMRGFWADERIDGGIWNLNNVVYKMIYKYFKVKEAAFLSNADYIVSLTNAAKKEIQTNLNTTQKQFPIAVIPCCADLNHFSINNTNPETVSHLKNTLGIDDNDFVLTYLGSIGTWYMLDEMLNFFKIIVEKYSSAKFLFITNENKDLIINAAKEKAINLDSIIIKHASRKELPNLLSLSSLSVFFIKPSYSKMASSPTKMAELMGMGIPIICNAGVGDNDYIMAQSKVGALISVCDNNQYKKVLIGMDDLLSIPKENIRTVALQMFSLEDGIRMYNEVYKALL